MRTQTYADLLNPGRILDVTLRSLDGKNRTAARKLINLVMPRVVPFNKPLGLKITDLTSSHCAVEIPFRRSNKNHLGSLHACALATVGEFAAGMLIMRRANPARQRLVLRKLDVDFLRQGRAGAVATADWPTDAPQSVQEFRKSNEAHEIRMVTIIRSKGGMELARVATVWQIKPWASVKGTKRG